MAGGATPTHVYENSIRGFSAQFSAQAAAALARNPNVAYVERDQIVELARPGSGGGGSAGQTTPPGITRVNGVASGVGLTACVIDSGVDLDHPDLTVDLTRSRTFVASGRDSQNADDGNGHGTHVSGTIAARNNTIGVVGVAPGATIVAVKVLDSQGSGAYSDVIAGVDYVGSGAAGCTVANMSLGGPVSQALDDAVVAASQARPVRARGRQRVRRRQQPLAGARQRPEHLHRLGGRRVRRVRVVQQLRQPAGRGRGAGRRHPLDVEGRRLQHDQRHLDGEPARGRHPAARRRPHERAARQATQTATRTASPSTEPPAGKAPRARAGARSPRGAGARCVWSPAAQRRAGRRRRRERAAGGRERGGRARRRRQRAASTTAHAHAARAGRDRTRSASTWASAPARRVAARRRRDEARRHVERRQAAAGRARARPGSRAAGSPRVADADAQARLGAGLGRRAAEVQPEAPDAALEAEPPAAQVAQPVARNALTPALMSTSAATSGLGASQRGASSGRRRRRA